MRKAPFKKRVLYALAAASLFALTTGAALAQQPVKKIESSKPAASPSQQVLDSWNEIGRKLIAMAEDFPEAKYDFKPTPEVRSFAEVLLHVAGTDYIFTDQAQGKPPRPHDLARNDLPAKADIVVMLKKAFEDGAAVIKAKGGKGMSQTVYFEFNNQMERVSDLAYSTAMHVSEHYGQLVVYYRLNRIVPPESRNP